MNDRELLELAAKAAGLFVADWNDGSEPYSSGDGFILESNALWNPLRSDGDALRLAVKLSIHLSLYRDTPAGQWQQIAWKGSEPFAEYAKIGPEDPMIASRRAIVRAAAEIGKSVVLHNVEVSGLRCFSRRSARLPGWATLFAPMAQHPFPLMRAVIPAPMRLNPFGLSQWPKRLHVL